MAKKKRTFRIKRNDKRRMDDGARKFIFKFARANLWRVEPDLTIDDLVQEGLWCWCYVLAHYPQAKDAPHLQRLLQLTFRSHITNLANKRTRDASALAEYPTFSPSNVDFGVQHLTTLVRQAPPEVKALLELFADPKSRRRLQTEAHKRSRRGYRETSNARLCRLAGIEHCDIIGATKEYLGLH